MAWGAEQVRRCYLGRTALLGLGHGSGGREVSRNLLRGDRGCPAPSSVPQHPSSSPVSPRTACHTPSSSCTRPLGPDPHPVPSDAHPSRQKRERVSQANSCPCKRLQKGGTMETHGQVVCVSVSPRRTLGTLLGSVACPT